MTKQKKFIKKILAFSKELAIIVGMVLVIQVGLVQAYHVPTGSMEGTILAGDFLFADKLTTGPRTPDWIGIPWTNIGFPIPAVKLPGIRDVKKNDIVVVRTPMDEHVPYVKRVVAVGGQTVLIKNKKLYVDGDLFPSSVFEQHVDQFTYSPRSRTMGIHPSLGNRDNWGPYEVPEGYIFLMGDNRDMSADSRFFGPVPETNVIGTARIVSMSWDKSENVPLLSRLRLGRIGKLLK